MPLETSDLTLGVRIKAVAPEFLSIALNSFPIIPDAADFVFAIPGMQRPAFFRDEEINKYLELCSSKNVFPATIKASFERVFKFDGLDFAFLGGEREAELIARGAKPDKIDLTYATNSTNPEGFDKLRNGFVKKVLSNGYILVDGNLSGLADSKFSGQTLRYYVSLKHPQYTRCEENNELLLVFENMPKALSKKAELRARFLTGWADRLKDRYQTHQDHFDFDN